MTCQAQGSAHAAELRTLAVALGEQAIRSFVLKHIDQVVSSAVTELNGRHLDRPISASSPFAQTAWTGGVSIPQPMSITCRR